MLVYSTAKYISTYADVFQISIGENGFLLIDKKTYDELLEAQLTVDIEDEKNKLGIENNCSAITFFETYVPQPISRLAILFDRLTFEAPLDLEVLFGILSTLSVAHGVMHWFRLSREDFKLYKFSDYILHEHEIPRKLFLTSCIPYEEMMNPEKVRDNIHHFLYLAPVGYNMGNTAIPTTGIGVKQSPGLCMDDDDQQYYLDRKEDYEYMGDGMFSDKNGNLVEIEVYDDDYLCREFGISKEIDLSPPDVLADSTPSGKQDDQREDKEAISDPSIELSPDNSKTAKSVHELFHRQRGKG